MNDTSLSAGKRIAIIGAFISVLGPLIGILAMIWPMISAMDALGPNGNGEQDLLAAIGKMVIATTIGFISAFTGWILLIIALTVLRYRARWFFWFNVIYSLLLMIGFIGLAADVGIHSASDLSAFVCIELVGLFLLIFTLAKRHGFFPPKSLTR